MSAIERLYRQVLKELGADQEPESLDIEHTPQRVAKMLTEELLVGYRQTEEDLLAKVRLFPAEDHQELVLEAPISFTSMCAHHMLPFAGHASIGYLPQDKILGLSKLSRILDYYAARLQIQERLGAQIADFIVRHAAPQAVFVQLSAVHFCMSCRGVKKPDVVTVTTSIRPREMAPHIKDEFYRMVEVAHNRSRS